MKDWLAGVGSSFPAWSRALAWKVWSPSGRFMKLALVAEENAPNGAPSRLQAKRRFWGAVRLSVPVKVNVASVVVIPPAGPPVIWVSGGVLSTMTVRVAEVGFPATSVAVAVRVWVPSRKVVVFQLDVAVTGEAGDVGERVVVSD